MRTTPLYIICARVQWLRTLVILRFRIFPGSLFTVERKIYDWPNFLTPVLPLRLYYMRTRIHKIFRGKLIHTVKITEFLGAELAQELITFRLWRSWILIKCPLLLLVLTN